MRLVFSLLVLFNGCFGATLDQFHVCTVASYEHPNLTKLIESCKKHQIDLEVLGMNQPYYWNGTKLLYMQEYLESLADDDLVLFVDAFDVLIVADKETILQKFLAMNAPFIMAAETNCYPHYHLADQYPDSPTPFKYINTGTYMGYVQNIKEWLTHLHADIYKGDQGQTTLDFLNTPPEERRFILDYNCELFFPLALIQDEWLKIDKKKKLVQNTITQTYPCVIHANGKFFHLWDQVYNYLVKPKKSYDKIPL